MPETVADHATLAPLWDPEKNEKAAGNELARSYHSAFWRCGNGHSFRRAPRLMLRDSSCPTCGVTSTSLEAELPHVAEMWHPSKNSPLTPSEVGAKHAADLWWQCEHGHAFARSPLQMAHDASCPTCVLADASLAKLFPELALEWHPSRNEIGPEQVDADHTMLAWWQCSKGHEFQATVRTRTRSSRRCPVCFGSWSLDQLRGFVKALLAHVDAFSESEKYALAMQAGALKNREGRAFVQALTSGRFPMSELQKFADGEPSVVDEFEGRSDYDLEVVDARAKPSRAQETGKFDLPAAPVDESEGEGDVDIDVSTEVDLTTRQDGEEESLPLVQTRDALAALDSALVANADSDTVRFLLASAKAKLWRHAYADPKQARQQAEAFQGDIYSMKVRDDFVGELDEAEGLKMPPRYSFRTEANGPIRQPNLMQRHVAVSVRNARRFGNWSGMGAGKTLSALISTRVVDAGLTVICCPNAVVENWSRELQKAFPNCEVAAKTWTPTWKHPLAAKPRYLVMNFEQFQLRKSEENLVAFLAENVVDFIVIDEIHYAKQREPGTVVSKRKKLVQGLVIHSGKKNPELCVLGMSGTPVINTLQEGKSLVEMIKGHRYDDLETKATVQNCMKLYQQLVTLGTRWKPDYPMKLDESARPEVDCGPYLDEIREVGRGTVLQLEEVLTRVRLPAILEHLVPGEKALIYTHYVTGIVELLRDAITEAGFNVGLFTGDDGDAGLNEFLDPHGSVDVLIASSRVGTGVDGLQRVCNKLIINCLPWTNAEYEQLRGRLWRQGSEFDSVSVVIPVTYAMVGGERWSYCESKLHRLEYKKSIADAAVDGVVPEGNLRTPAQAQQDIMGWLSRLEAGETQDIIRRPIRIPLSGEPSDVDRRVSRYGDFTKMNNRWYQSKSSTTHARLAANPEEWEHYHTMYRGLRESWTVVPYEEEIRWLEGRDALVVGDFGCGEALLGKAASEKHRVYSFDHIAIDSSVIACDIASVPLDDEELDVAVFSLSLMGTNFTDYIREARRCLRLDGELHIWEAADYFKDVKAFCAGLRRLGFDYFPPETHGRFLCIRARKNTKAPDPNVTLRFRGKEATGVE